VTLNGISRFVSCQHVGSIIRELFQTAMKQNLENAEPEFGPVLLILSIYAIEMSEKKKTQGFRNT
jgi:hypothetical protein